VTNTLRIWIFLLLAAAIAQAQQLNPSGRAKAGSDRSAREQLIERKLGDFDIRKHQPDSSAKDAAQRRTAERKTAIANYLASGAAPGLEGARAKVGPSGALERIFNDRTPLTKPAQGDREAIARGFLRTHAELFSLDGAEVGKLRLASRTDSGPLTVLRFQQSVDGVDVLHGLVRVTVNADGAIIEAGAGDLLLDGAAPGSPDLTAEQAVGAAFEFAGHDAPAQLVKLASSTRNTTDFANPIGPRLNPIRVELVLFPLADAAHLAYRIYLDLGGTEVYQFVIDASNGRLLLRQHLMDSTGQARIFPNSPIAGGRELRDLPDGSIPNDGTVTIGNNIDAYVDANGDNLPDATTGPSLDDGRASSDTQVFDFPFGDGTTAEDPTDFPAAAITNAFYFTNFAHDYFYDLGFDEAAGNYQVDNFGLGGTGGDPIFVEVHDANSENSAGFTRAPEGLPGRLQLGIFTILTGSEDARDAAYEAQVIIHEYTHGVSNRLAAGPSNIDCLRGTQSRGMGEGWSDYFSLSITDDPVQGAYLTGNAERGIRRASYENYPFTYGDLGNDRFDVPHDEGEIWAATLWDSRSALGAVVMDQLVYDGLTMTGCSPDMVDGRDAILAADQALNGGANRAALWDVFAERGMGFSAGGRDGGGSDLVIFNAAFDLPPDLHQGNRGPMITSTPPPGTAELGQPYVYDIESVDPEGDALTFELGDAPQGMTIDPVTGRIEWTASFVDQRVVVNVRDGSANLATHGFVIPVITELQPDQPVAIAAGVMQAGLAFIEVPANVPVLQVRLRGEQGDADLLVFSPTGFPSISLLDGSVETLSFRNPEPGVWGVIVSAFASFQDVTLEAALPVPTRIARNGEWTGLAGVVSSETFFEVNVPAGVDTFRIMTAGGTGDVDLFAAQGAVAVCQSANGGAPCLVDADSINDGNGETIEILEPAAGPWFIDLNAFSEYTGVTLMTEVTGDTLLPSIPQGGVALATQTPVIPEISPGSIVTAAGGNFAPPGTFVISPILDGDSRVTTELAKTCLEIGGFLSPMFAATSGQANAQAHHELSLGMQDVFLIRDCGTVDETRSPAGQINVTEVSPGFFHFVNNLDGVNPIATLHGGGPGLVGEPGLLPGADFTEAEPDEVVSFFTTGFGPYETLIEAGQIPGVVLPDTNGTTRTVHDVTLEIDGVVVPPEDLFYVGSAPCCAGLVQMVAKIHADARDGRLPVKATVNGVSTPDGSYVSVRKRK